jgi:hypothetical protein
MPTTIASKSAIQMGLLDQVCNALRETRWSFAVQQGIGRITMKVSTNEGQTYSVHLSVRDEACLIIGLFLYPRRCEPEHFDRMLTFLSRQNFDLVIGGFEMDPENGSLKFRNSIDLQSVPINSELIDGFLKMLVSLGARYDAALSAVLDGKSLDTAYGLMG